MTRVLNVFKKSVAHVITSLLQGDYSLWSCKASSYVLWGEMICMARRWIVSTAWLCSFVSAVDHTWHQWRPDRVDRVDKV